MKKREQHRGGQKGSFQKLKLRYTHPFSDSHHSSQSSSFSCPGLPSEVHILYNKEEGTGRYQYGSFQDGKIYDQM